MSKVFELQENIPTNLLRHGHDSLNDERLSKPLTTDRNDERTSKRGGETRKRQQDNDRYDKFALRCNNDRTRDRSRSRSRSRDKHEYSRSARNNTDPIRSNRSTTVVLKDEKLGHLDDDPRINSDHRTGMKVTKKSGVGRNTESFDPKSTLVRPQMRIIVGPNQPRLNRAIKHDDVVVVPNFFCAEDDWSIYYQLIEEMREAQQSGLKKSEWTSWHEGAHLISHNPSGSATFRMIQQKISDYFDIQNKSVGTRFNWYADSSDWKPFHHDSAAFNPQRARSQNITVGVSFGASRELAFLHAASNSSSSSSSSGGRGSSGTSSSGRSQGQRIYFPQTNGMMFSFGRDVNINWKHGVNALSEEEQLADGRGRISIILWGLCDCTIEEDNSPPMLTDNTRGNGHSMHAITTTTTSTTSNTSATAIERQQWRGINRSRDDRQQVYGYNNSRDRSRSDDRHDDNSCKPFNGRNSYNSHNRGREGAMNVSVPDAASDVAVCRDFQRGHCRFGEKCRFFHPNQ